MSSYTITITPDDTSNASATLRVSLGPTGARIKELTVRAGDGEGFAPEELPGFELSRLIGAIAPAGPVIEAAAPAIAAGTPLAEVVHARAAAQPRRRGRPAKAAKATAAKATATKSTATKSTAAKAAAAKTAGKKAGAKKESRAYRRMPDDVVAVYRQAGGATALANHYGVPRHTAQGWLRRLRQQGDIPS